MRIPITQLIKELQKQPYTMLTILSLCIAAAWGYSQFARADDLRQMEARVDKKMAGIGSKVANNGGKIDRVLALQLADAIRSLQRHVCNTKGPEKSTLQHTLNSLQADYKAMEGQIYDTPGCPL